jgi:O-antigen ligase
MTAGILIRAAVRKQHFDLPPLGGWIVAWLLVIGVQLANPSNGTLFHSLASVRPLAEFVPLFFLGYFTIRSRAALRAFLLLLLVVAAVNGIVGLVQLNLNPEELSSWGPGYERAINGEGDVSGRTFFDNEGVSRVRPFALGGDFGFGGTIGMIAIPAALALLALTRRRGIWAVSALLAGGAIVGIATSEARVAVLGSVIAAFAFAVLTVTSRGGLRTVFAIGLALIVTYATIGLVFSDSESGTFDRYESINSPGRAVSTALDYRKGTMARIPKYAVDFPLGAGIGQAGPASSVAGGNNRKLDAESEPTYLLIEVGIPGLMVMLGFFGTLIYISFTRIRKIPDREARILLTGVAAPIFAIVVTGYVGINTANVPNSPYLWFAAGVLSYWLLGDGRSLTELSPSRRSNPRSQLL